jgi:conjugative transfer signal peptidase TraF
MTRFGYVTLTAITAGAVAVSAFFNPLPRVIWNASASAPIGLYAVHQSGDPPIGSMVAVAPPKPLARWMAVRHYLPLGVPLLKHVNAKAGQQVCRNKDIVSVDGKVVGKARPRDSHGRDLPSWTGCRTLRSGQIFLMNTDVPDSLDGRYFGPFPVASVIGRVTPILTRDAPDRRLKWRGFPF